MWFSRATRVPRILRACAVGAGLVTFTADAQAQSAADKYPDKPIKIIVPFAPGGSADTLGRLVAGKLSEQLKESFVIENRGGAGGAVGSDLAAKIQQADPTRPAKGY